MSRRIVQRLSKAKAKINSLNPYAGHYFTANTSNFPSHEEMGGIDGIKIPRNHTKTEPSASKSIIYTFRAALWPMSHTQTITFQYIKITQMHVSNINYHFLVSLGHKDVHKNKTRS